MKIVRGMIEKFGLTIVSLLRLRAQTAPLGGNDLDDTQLVYIHGRCWESIGLYLGPNRSVRQGRLRYLIDRVA